MARNAKSDKLRRRTAATSCTATGRLLLHPPPDPLESDCGYGLRLADANGFSCLKRLFAALGMTPTFATVLGKEGVYAIASGQRRLSAEELGTAIKETDALIGVQPFSSVTRFCPKCLAERGVWKSEWDLPLAIACTRHRAELLCACDKCGASVSYFAHRRLYTCQCGHDFRESEAEPAPSWVSELDAIFRPWLLPGRLMRSQSEMYELDRGSSIVLQRLIWEASCNSNHRYPRRKVARIPSASYSIVEALVARWPEGLNATLRRRALHWTAPQRGELARLVRLSAPPLVRDAVTTLLGSIGAIRSTASSARPTTRAVPPAPGLVSLESVRHALGIANQYTDSMFDKCEMERATMAIHTNIKWVDEQELRFALWLRRHMPRLSEAAQFLGCREQRLRWLVRSGLLAVAADRRLPGLARVRVSEMSKLVGELTLRSTRPEGTLDGYVTITNVGSNVTHYHRKWCDLIRRVLNGGEELFLLGQESLGLGNFAVRGEVAARTSPKRRSQGAAD